MDALVEALRLARVRARAIAAERAAAHINHAKRQVEYQQVLAGLMALDAVAAKAALNRAEVILAASKSVVDAYVKKDAEAQTALQEAEKNVEEWPMREQQEAQERQRAEARARAYSRLEEARERRLREQQQQKEARERAEQRQEQQQQEARERARRQQQQNRKQPQAQKKQEPKKPSLTLAACNAWKTRADAVLVNFSELKFFPTPPVTGTCKNQSCTTSKGTRALEACSCDIRAVFEMLKATVSLKEERRKWHPDRFSACREDKREKFQAMAQEIFMVVDAMYANEKEVQKA